MAVPSRAERAVPLQGDAELLSILSELEDELQAVTATLVASPTDQEAAQVRLRRRALHQGCRTPLSGSGPQSCLKLPHPETGWDFCFAKTERAADSSRDRLFCVDLDASVVRHAQHEVPFQTAQLPSRVAQERMSE